MLKVWSEYFLEVHCISFDPSCWASDPFGPNPGQEAFCSEIFAFGGRRPAFQNFHMGTSGTDPFLPNPGQEPFWSQIFAFGGSSVGYLKF